MNVSNEDSLWVMLYKKRLDFINNSVDEFLVDMENKKNLKNIQINKKEHLDMNKCEVYNIIIKALGNNNIHLKKKAKEILDKKEEELIENENMFIEELNIQNYLSNEIIILEDEKMDIDKRYNNEWIKLSKNIDKIFNHFNQTMDSIKESGLKNILDRKAFNVIDVLQCFKKNIYEYFMKIAIDFKNSNYELDFNNLIGFNMSSELDKLEDDITEYIFHKYISESQWKIIIEGAKDHSLKCLDICKKYELQIFVIMRNYLEKKVENTNKLLENSINKVEQIKKERYTMEKKLEELIDEYEALNNDSREEIQEKIMFKELVTNNYIIEYNRVVKLINNNNNIKNGDITTYFEYLYLITKEMQKMEEALYG